MSEAKDLVPVKERKVKRRGRVLWLFVLEDR